MEKEILQILSGIRPEFDFEESDDFIEDGYLDSFDIVTLVAELENAFDILIDPVDVSAKNFSDLASICRLIKNN